MGRLARPAGAGWHARRDRLSGGRRRSAALVPAAYQRLVVQPNELARETPQIANHIRATRQAWGLEGIEDRELGTDTRLTPALIAANRATIDNVRLWDREPLLQTFGQIQSIRTYYDFLAVDDDRYRIGGQLRQVMLSAREMNTSALPTRGFINEHLTYTHGMGVTLGPSNEVTAEGLPVLFIKDLPPVSSIATSRSRGRRSTTARCRTTSCSRRAGSASSTIRRARVTRPRIRRTTDVAASRSARSCAGCCTRCASGRSTFVLSTDLTDRTRILYYRDVRERAERALPFLLFDRDPYLVITADGRLVWMLDGYTTSDRYPYSRAASRAA